jgi:lipopolysaccharide export LptBFGC system permease protein LptF
MDEQACGATKGAKKNTKDAKYSLRIWSLVSIPFAPFVFFFAPFVVFFRLPADIEMN